MRRTVILAAGCTFVSSVVAGCSSIKETVLLPIEESIVFQNSKRPQGTWDPDPQVEDVWFHSADGAEINGWYAEAKKPRAVVLFAHGNAGNITHLRPILHLFRDQLKTSILVFDYRGYGRSGGNPTEPGALMDARAARCWLAKRAGVAETDIVLAGHSLGGGVAVDLAAREGARGLVLISTFTSLPDAAETHVPLRALMQMNFDSLSKISHYRGPLLQCHGDADRVIPYDLGIKLFEAANEPKKFIAVPGAGHTDSISLEFVKALDQFLESLPVN